MGTSGDADEPKRKMKNKGLKKKEAEMNRGILILTIICGMMIAGAFAQEGAKVTPLPIQQPQQEQPQLSDKAKIVLSEESFDFGYVYPGARVSHTIQIKNAGTDTLRLERPRPSCGCTTAPLKKQVLAPGESEDLEIVFNSMGYNRPTTKTVAVISNDAQRPSAIVTFKANMDTTSFPKIIFEPRDINFGQGKGFKQSLEIAIKNGTEETLKLKLGPKPQEFATWSLASDEIKPGKSTKLTIKLSPTLNAENYFSGSFYLAFSGKENTFNIHLPFSGGGQIQQPKPEPSPKK